MVAKKQKGSEDLIQLKEEIHLFIEYGVGVDEREDAVAYVKKNDDNVLVLMVLRDFYSQLPEFREEAVLNVERVMSRLECYLLQVNTRSHEYLYLYNGEAAFYIGEKKDGINDKDILDFFGYTSNDMLLRDLDNQKPETAEADGQVAKSFCPVCSVAEGELHEFGCPVEICPWCDSQFTYCNCRFERLGVDEIVGEDQLDRLEIMMNDQGRIPFSADQAPAYPLDLEERDDQE